MSVGFFDSAPALPIDRALSHRTAVEIWRLPMRTILLTAAAVLGFAVSAPAFANAQTAGSYTLVDCMVREGGPTGCSSPYQDNTSQYYRNGRFAARNSRQIQSDANAYY